MATGGPAGGAYSTPPDYLAGFERGCFMAGEKGGEWRGGNWREAKGIRTGEKGR